MICLQKLRDVLVCENNFQGTLFCVRVVCVHKCVYLTAYNRACVFV